MVANKYCCVRLGAFQNAGIVGGAACGGVLLAESVGRTLSPSARVVVLLKSDFLAYFC
jgi:hypothetical protein